MALETVKGHSQHLLPTFTWLKAVYSIEIQNTQSKIIKSHQKPIKKIKVEPGKVKTDH